jgi:hypothetical protein
MNCKLNFNTHNSIFSTYRLNDVNYKLSVMMNCQGSKIIALNETFVKLEVRSEKTWTIDYASVSPR